MNEQQACHPADPHEEPGRNDVFERRDEPKQNFSKGGKSGVGKIGVERRPAGGEPAARQLMVINQFVPAGGIAECGAECEERDKCDKKSDRERSPIGL
jgi:hypothetical protein